MALLKQIEKACIRHEHEYSFIYTGAGGHSHKKLSNLVQNTCIAGLLGSILRNILRNQTIHRSENILVKEVILRIQKHCNNYLVAHVRSGLEWNYYPINTQARVPNDLDDTSLALYSLSSPSNATIISNHCHKLIANTSSYDHKINSWLRSACNPAWFHEDITVLANFGRLCDLYGITHEPLTNRIYHHITDDRKSIFYVNNWWALYALSTWLHDTTLLNQLYDSCASKESRSCVSTLELLCFLKLRQRGIIAQINTQEARVTYHNLITAQDNNDETGIYYEKINRSQILIAHSPIIKLAIEVEILLYGIHKE